MIPRRRLVGVGVLGGALSALVRETPAAASSNGTSLLEQGSEEGLARVAREITALRDELKTERQFTELAPLREAQRVFLRVNGKFPDYIEVGFDVWFAVHDWHVRWNQPLTIARDGLGRYTIALNQTLVVLRSDVLGSFVGLPYDNR
jgi:hypothetical protein